MNKFDDTQLYVLLNESNYEKINTFLQKYGLDSVDRDGRTFLMSAIVEGKEDVVNYLVNIGCNVNTKDKSGLTALHFAVIYDRFTIVKVLITHGAEIDAVDNVGNTPLWRAIMENSNETSTIRYLLENGADPSKANNRGIAPKDLLE
ncbi:MULTISPECIES: ankyrin repeat domain-containing protein [unclassified Lysinibacillus]|uniref:ankyrin repeat domain-containing protein n=1 Tax=unclassified Lysinibacillus TaxID=2636778 RepID=UPI002557B793|nr:MULTISPECIES: ankyrin repeat domain-containing protein [unclassified Lysinibacillus]MDM5247994.1 ankyrin repeat domain-containing protein [Lysinibacillus sp. G4S2]